MTEPRNADNFIDYSLYTKTLKEVSFESPLLVNTINQYSYCMANEDADFKKSLQMSDILLPDGISIVAAEFILTGKRIKKISGADFHSHLLNTLNKISGSCFYLGASDSTLKKIEKKISLQYPNIKVGNYSPPFKKIFSSQENMEMVDTINTFQPDVLFVGMTAPKQEIWAYKHKLQLNVKTICTIGAVFDFYAGTVKRPSQFLIDMGLEWFGRLLNEPKRLWKRYLYYGPVFIGLILREKIKQVFLKKEYGHAI